jgi:TorA maturation chaperone TorD
MQEIGQDKAAAREILCRFLAACYYEPGPEFVEEKLFDSILAVASCIDADLKAHAKRLGAAFFAERAEDLLVDYTQLFLGPNNIAAKPYGSVWLEREHGVMQDSTMAVQELYAEGGFDIAEDFHELPDHIAVELEFLYLLLHDENEALRAGDPAELARVRDLRKRFLRSHLGAWVGPFTEAVTAGARCGFYRELAAMSQRFLATFNVGEH